jgi:alanine racemase
MQGVFSQEEARICLASNATPVLSRMEQLDWIEVALSEETRYEPYFVWLKVQTGLNRIGFDSAILPEVIARVQQNKTIDYGLMTHWSCADTPDHPAHIKQYARVQELLANYPDKGYSVNSSHGIANMPEFNHGWVRAGAWVYGISMPHLPTRAVMELTSQIIQLRRAKAGESIGYGAKEVLDQDASLAVVTIGYGDGYPRNIAPNTHALVRDQRVPILGRISMDMLVLDVTELSHVVVGDKVILWGRGLSVDEIARSASTISYELVSGIGHRVKFEWDDAPEDEKS